MVLILVCMAGVVSPAHGQTPQVQAKKEQAKPSNIKKTPPSVVPAKGETPPPLASVRTVIPSFDLDGAEYLLVAWSESGLTMVSDCDDRFSLGAPLTTLHAQLIKRGPSPKVVNSQVALTYAVEGLAAPSSKSRFWAFSQSLTGKALAPDTGPSGKTQRGTLDLSGLTYTARDIPVMPYAPDGSFLPYPTVSVEARDPSTNRILAATRAVLPVSTQLGCAKCHGGAGAGPGLSQDTATRILTAHDRNSGTSLLAQAKAGKPQACASCHAGGPTGSPAAGSLALSASIHGFHAAKLAGKGAEACGFCHAVDAPTRFSRDFHARRGTDCVACHGFMEDHALALLKAEQASGRARAGAFMTLVVPRLAETPARTARAMQSDCSGCHDFTTRPTAASRAFGKWAGGTAPLYRERPDLSGGLKCIACHSPAHAVYPAASPLGRDRDNIQPIQYQGLAKSLGAGGNCKICHTVDMDRATSVHHPLPKRIGLTVAVPQGVDLRRPRVLFPHQAHAAEDCRTCHHTGYVEGKALSCTTQGCHDQPGADGKALYFRNAFHGPGASCNACHQARIKAGQPAGPVECGSCHIPGQ